jgi:hypothetical protein
MTVAPIALTFAPTVATEARRRLVVRAILFMYFLSLIEGPLRKWFLPELAGPITLLRDPFVIAIYAYALAGGMMMRRGIASIWLGFAALTSGFGVLQYETSGFNLAGWMLGVRAYWLYLPLAFVVAKTFRYEDVMSFLRLNLWIALPYAMLVASQSNAGTGAWINQGIGGDEEASVRVAHGIVRPFGLFTFTSPNVHFTAFMIAMFVALLLAASRARPPLLLFLAMAAAVGTMAVLTGSRVIYFQVAAIFGITIIVVVLVRPTTATLRRILLITSLFPFTGLLFVTAFPEMLAAMEVRFDQALAIERSIWNRVYYSFFTFIDAFQVAPVFGHGIGAGAPGVAQFLGLPQFLFGEADTQRNVNELGIFLGAILLLLRWWLAIWLVILSLRLARRGTLSAAPLAGFAFFAVGADQLTNSPILSFYTWMAVGLILALRNSHAAQTVHQLAGRSTRRGGNP